MSSPCSTLRALEEQQLALMDRLNNKVTALQRLADLASSVPVPSIDGLIPVAQVDSTTYNLIRASCPFLNLPPLDVDNMIGLTALRSQLTAAYQDLLNSLDGAPIARLARFKTMLDRFKSRMNVKLEDLANYTRCAAGVCQAASRVANGTAIQRTYQANFVDAPNEIFSSASKPIEAFNTTRSYVAGKM